MSSKIDSQLQLLHAPQKYFVWANYYLSPPPLSNNDIQKLIKKSKKDYYKYFDLKSYSKDSISKTKSELSQCVNPNQIESVLKASFELTAPLGQKFNLIQYSVLPEIQSEKKEVKNYIEYQMMTMLIAISSTFEENLFAFRANLRGGKFPPEIWKNFYLFFDYFSEAKEKVFLDFSIVMEPIISALNVSIEAILKLDETKLALVFLNSIIDPIFKCLQVEHQIKKQSNSNSLFLSFFVNLVKGVLHCSRFELLKNSLDNFFEFECKNCLDLCTSDQNLLTEISKEFILKIQDTDFLNEKNDEEREKTKRSLFRIGFNCSKINTALCCSLDNSYITFSIDFVIWSITTFPVKLFKFPNYSTIKRPIDTIKIDSPIEFEPSDTSSTNSHLDSNGNGNGNGNGDIKSKHKTPNPISYLCSNEQLNDLYNHLIEIRPIYQGIANKEIVYSHLKCSYDAIDSIENKHVFIAFSIVLLKKMPNIKSEDATFQYLFEPSVFNIPNDAPEGKPPSFSQLDRLTSNFISRLQSFIFKFAKKACVMSDGRRTILSSLGAQLDKVKANESEMYYYVQNILPLLILLMFFDLTAFGIVDTLLEFMNTHLNTSLGIQLFKFIQTIILKNPTLYFGKKTIIDQFTVNSKNEFFTQSIYKTLITSLKYCSARKEFTKLFEEILRYISKCLMDEYKINRASTIDIMTNFIESVKELNLSSFYYSHFPGDIINTLIEIPKLMKRDDILLNNLNFMKDYGCISNFEASETFTNSLKDIELTVEIINILTYIIFEENVDIKDENNYSKIIIKNNYGLKPLIMLSLDTKYEDDVLLFIFNIMAYNKNRYNCLQCSNGGVVKCALLIYIKKQKDTCINIINMIIGINPTPSSLSSIYEIFSDLSKNPELNDSVNLNWLADFLCKLSGEKEYDNTLFADFDSPIKDVQINSSLFGKSFSILSVVSFKGNERTKIFEFVGSNNVTIEAYYENFIFHVQVETSEKVIGLDFPGASKKLQLKWKELNFIFNQHYVSFNNEKVPCELPILSDSCKLNIGSENIQLSVFKIESIKKQKIVYELDPKLYKQPNLFLACYGDKVKDQTLIEMPFKGFITYFESLRSSFKNSDLFVTFFEAMKNKKYFRSFLSFFQQIFKELQDTFYEKKYIFNFVDTLENSKEFTSPNDLKMIYSAYRSISVPELKKQYLVEVLMNPSLFIQAQFPTALEYCGAILPDISSTYQEDFYNFFNEAINFNKFFEGILAMSHDNVDSEKLVDIIWPLFQDIFIKKHCYSLYKTFIIAMRKCKNYYFAYNAILFFEEKIELFCSSFFSSSENSSSSELLLMQSKTTKPQHIRRSDTEKLTDEQKSDLELQKALFEDEALPMFILIIPLVSDDYKRVCLKCLGNLVHYSKVESGYLTHEVFSILGKFDVENKNVVPLISDCMNLMQNYQMTEMLPLISYLISFLKSKEDIENSFRDFYNSLNESIVSAIPVVPFWLYFLMMIYQKTKDNSAPSKISLGDELFQKFFGGILDLRMIYTAFFTFDTLTLLYGDDFHSEKEKILKSFISQFDMSIFDPSMTTFDENPHLSEQANFIDLMSLLFSLLFVQIKTDKSDDCQLVSKYNFNVEELQQYSKLVESVSRKHFVFDIRMSDSKYEEKHKWLDSDIADFFIEKIQKVAECIIQYKLFWFQGKNESKFAIPVQKALSYVIATKLRIDKESLKIDDIVQIVTEIEKRSDGGFVHDMVGMILATFGFINVRQQIAPNEFIQALYDSYDVVHDSLDSPDLDLFIFENYLDTNLDKMASNRFCQMKK